MKLIYTKNLQQNTSKTNLASYIKDYTLQLLGFIPGIQGWLTSGKKKIVKAICHINIIKIKAT